MYTINTVIKMMLLAMLVGIITTLLLSPKSTEVQIDSIDGANKGIQEIHWTVFQVLDSLQVKAHLTGYWSNFGTLCVLTLKKQNGKRTRTVIGRTVEDVLKKIPDQIREITK